MKIELTKQKNPLADLFAAPLTTEGEADYQKLMFVEDLLRLMKDRNISRRELARRMEIQPSRVTSMLTGTNNFTIETMIRAARAVEAEYHHCLAPMNKIVSWQCWEKADVHPAFLRAKSSARKCAEVTFDLPGISNEDSGAAA